jgi:hypothetical protein
VNTDDWGAVKGIYGQVQMLDKNIQLVTGIIGKQQEVCAALRKTAKEKKSGNDSRNRAEKEDAANGKEPANDTAEENLAPKHSSARELFFQRNHIPDLDGTLTELEKSGALPSNYVTKTQARALGWKPGMDLSIVAPGKIIGGDIFENRENLLPSAPGRLWREADLNYVSGPRGPVRLLYSDDGLRYLSNDHYTSVEQIPP